MINRVVAIDDDEHYLAMLSEFAKLFDVEFIGYSDYSQFDFNNLTNNDLLLVDIFMPNDDGLDILMAAGKSQFSGNVAVMSGATDDIVDSVANLVESLDVNLCGKLKKPFKISDFKAIVEAETKGSAQKKQQMTPEVATLFPQLFKKKNIKLWFEKGYIYPVFQPQIDSKTRAIVGFECLTRVNHPQLGFVSPDLFIRLVESAELIDIYTLHFIDQSLAKTADLLAKYKEVSCSFNISANNLNISFVDQFVRLLAHHKVASSQITIEVTESSAISMSQDALYAISRLKVSGVALAIDDFGTGYSAIKQLVELPFDELKIDRSFINDIETSGTLKAIVNATIDMANSLEYKLVIEGVETESQLSFLEQKSHFVVQGYLFSKPLKIDELNDFWYESTNHLSA